LHDLRAARRRHYAEDFDWLDALYRVYVGAIFGAWGLALISGALADAEIGQHGVDQIALHGPAVLGLLVALAVAGGLRSGGRGGPLAIEAAEVQHVLLSPVDRTVALRGLALRRLRTAAFIGGVVGAIAGNFAFRRLPGSPAEWLACGALFGAAIPLAGLGGALVASGRRLRPVVVNLLALLVVGSSCADIALETKTSPATMLGEVALWPLHGSSSVALPLIGFSFAALLVLLGLRWIAGTSLEAVRRRAALTAELRFAVTLQDLRTVILLRRQLASERPRSRPWIRLPVPPRGSAIWRRDCQSFLRWPTVRVARVTLLGAVAGVALLGAWQGTTPLLLVAGLSLLVAGLDAVEPLAQEMDHPIRRDLLPIPATLLIRLHLFAPIALMVGVCLMGLATIAVAGGSGSLLGVGALMVIPSALMVLCCAALSATNDPYAYLLTPGIGYAQSALPFVIPVLGVGLPLLAAREAEKHGRSAIGAAFGIEIVLVVICLALIGWLGHRVAQQVPVKA
jgi:hypothetical protein